jgi:hypothetical protein
MTSPRAFERYRHTALWDAVEAAVTELQATREIAVATAPDYVIGYLCERLAARQLVAPTGMDEPK